MTSFYMGSEHSHRSEKMPEIKLRESILVREGICQCGACSRVLKAEALSSSCPNEDCAVTWKQIVLGAASQPIPGAHLPSYGIDVIKVAWPRITSHGRATLGRRTLKDVVIVDDIL